MSSPEHVDGITTAAAAAPGLAATTAPAASSTAGVDGISEEDLGDSAGFRGSARGVEGVIVQ